MTTEEIKQLKNDLKDIDIFLEEQKEIDEIEKHIIETIEKNKKLFKEV